MLQPKSIKTVRLSYHIEHIAQSYRQNSLSSSVLVLATVVSWFLGKKLGTCELQVMWLCPCSWSWRGIPLPLWGTRAGGIGAATCLCLEQLPSRTSHRMMILLWVFSRALASVCRGCMRGSFKDLTYTCSCAIAVFSLEFNQGWRWAS